MSNRSTEYTYVTIWTAVTHLKTMYDVAMAEPQRKDEALALRFAVLTLDVFALEAFLNHMISVVSPEVWSQEKKYFNQGKCRGLVGKLKYIRTLCLMPCDENEHSVILVRELTAFRNAMAHAKTREETPGDIPITRYPPPLKPPQLFTLGTHNLLARSHSQIQIMRRELFDVMSRNFPETDLGFPPDLGVSMSEITRVIQ